MGCPLGPDVEPAAKKHRADMGCLYGLHEDAHMGATKGPHGHAGRGTRSVVTPVWHLGRPFMTRAAPWRRAISAGQNGRPQMRWAPWPIGHWVPRVKKKWTQLKC